MREFSLLGFAAFTAGMVATVEHAKHHALEEAAKIVETEAKRVIGTYDYGWTPLAASTLAKKAADTPLLETGEMRDSIEHTIDGDTAYVGSNNDKAVWQELGTVGPHPIPPRSFLVGAAQHKAHEIVKETGHKVVAALKGSKV